MAEFCSCGSIVINGRCTNKNCDLRGDQKSGTPEKAPRKASASRKAPSSDKASASSGAVEKPSRTRRASKCITYNIKDLKKDEENT